MISLSPQYKYITNLKRWVWLYIFLLLFEGALRRWIFPSLSDILLVVRDPIGLWIIVNAWYHKILIPNGYVKLFIAIGLLSFITTLLFGHGNMAVALYGLRIFFIQLPLMFAIGDIPPEFRSEVAFIGTWMRHEKRDEFLLKLIDAGIPLG